MLGLQGSRGRGPAALRVPRAGAHELQVQVSTADAEPSLRLKPQDTRPHPESTHAPRWGTPAPAHDPGWFLPLLKGQKGLPPQGKARNHGSEPVCCRKSIKCCGAKMHSQPVSVSPRTLCTGRGETHRDPAWKRGHHPVPKQPLHGHCKAHTADVPTFLPGAARCQGQDPTNYPGTEPVSHGPGGPGTE